MKELFLVSAENSSERYGVDVLSALRERLGPSFSCFGAGGKRLAASGMEVLVPSAELSVAGLVEVARHIPRLMGLKRRLLEACLRRRPQAALLIDFPDFNLSLAASLKAAGIPVFFFISPSIWAWRYGRVKTLRQRVDHTFLIYPFEAPIYQREGLSHTYVGHPLLPHLPLGEGCGEERRGDRILLLPGSRPGEVHRLLGPLLETLHLIRRERPDIGVELIQADSISDGQLEAARGMGICFRPQMEAYPAMREAGVVLAACGTTTLEAALLGAPALTTYRVNRLSYLLGKPFVHIPRYSIVNILLGREVIPEFIQRRCQPRPMARMALELLGPSVRAVAQQEAYRELRNLLGNPLGLTPAGHVAGVICGDLPRADRR